MGSPANEQYNLIRSYNMNEKAVSATVTLRVGRDNDYFQIDNPINVNVADDYTITLPNGIQANQELFFFCSARIVGKTTTIDPATGSNRTLDAVGEWVIVRWTDTTTGWVKIKGATGT